MRGVTVLKHYKQFIACISVLSILIAGCSNWIENEKNGIIEQNKELKIIVEKRLGEEINMNISKK